MRRGRPMRLGSAALLACRSTLATDRFDMQSIVLEYQHDPVVRTKSMRREECLQTRQPARRLELELETVTRGRVVPGHGSLFEGVLKTERKLDATRAYAYARQVDLESARQRRRRRVCLKLDSTH